MSVYVFKTEEYYGGKTRVFTNKSNADEYLTEFMVQTGGRINAVIEEHQLIQQNPNLVLEERRKKAQAESDILLAAIARSKADMQEVQARVDARKYVQEAQIELDNIRKTNPSQIPAYEQKLKDAQNHHNQLSKEHYIKEKAERDARRNANLDPPSPTYRL